MTVQRSTAEAFSTTTKMAAADRDSHKLTVDIFSLKIPTTLGKKERVLALLSP